MELPLNEIITGDCLEVMPTFGNNIFDTIITDPPYGLGFMGKEWDTFKEAKKSQRKGEFYTTRNIGGAIVRHTKGWSAASDAGLYDHSRNAEFQQWFTIWAKEALRVAKPGAIMLIFGGTRTSHRLACAIEDAGWLIRDKICWIFGSGFPKSLNFGCKCRENAVPYNHEQKAKHNMRPLRKTDISPEEYAKDKSRQVLLKRLSEQSTQKLWTERTKPQTCGQEESGVEGRQLHRTRKRLSNDTKSKTSKSQSERLCSGAHSDGRETPGKAISARRRSTSPKRRQTGQSAQKPSSLRQSQNSLGNRASGNGSRCSSCGGLTDFVGYGTALKPAYEDIFVAMKPLDGTFAQNAEKWGVAGLNIDGGRISTNETFEIGKPSWGGPHKKLGFDGKTVDRKPPTNQGRWPANVILDEEAAAMLDEQSGETIGTGPRFNRTDKRGDKAHTGYCRPNASMFTDDVKDGLRVLGDSGGASRFFYCAKASRAERNAGLEGMPIKEARRTGISDPQFRKARGRKAQKVIESNNHPTVKPLKLMEYLCKLTRTPTGGVVLDPFGGSGTTAMACVNTDRDYVVIEKDKSYCEIAEKRVAWAAKQKAGQMPLFKE